MTAKIKTSCFFHKDQDFESCRVMLENLIKRFEETGLLNDSAYTQASVNSMRRQGRSERAIKSKLHSKGLPEELIGKALETHDSGEYENPGAAELHAAVIYARKKRLGPYASVDRIQRRDEPPEKSFEKTMGAFGRAGFSFDTARTVLEMNTEEATDIIRKNA